MIDRDEYSPREGPHSAADRWMQEQLFEEDVRAVLKMMRPHRRERLQGWSEYRTGGANFRITISWDQDFVHEPMDDRALPGEALPGEALGGEALPGEEARDLATGEKVALAKRGHRDEDLAVPQMARVLETILVGSARNGDELTPQEEFAIYRSVAQELARRLDELENCYT